MKKIKNNDYDKSLPFDTFMGMSRDDKTLYLLSYARQYNLDILSLKKYDKVYKGCKILTKEDVDSQLYESLALTLKKLEEVGLVVKSPKTKRIKKLFFKNEANRAKARKWFTSKKVPTLLLENVLITKPKLSAKVLKEHKEAKARGEFPKFPKRKRAEVYVFDSRKLNKTKKELIEQGFDVEEYNNFFQATSHVAHYFRLNFIHQLQKTYTFLTRNMRMPSAGFQDISKYSSDSDTSEHSMDNLSDSSYSSVGWGTSEVNSTDGNDLKAMHNQTIQFLTECNEFYALSHKTDESLVDSYVQYLETAKKHARQNYTNIKMLRLLIFFWNAESNPSHILQNMDIKTLHLLVRAYVPPKYNALKRKMEELLKLNIFDGFIDKEGNHHFLDIQPEVITYQGKEYPVISRKWDKKENGAVIIHSIKVKRKQMWVQADK